MVYSLSYRRPSYVPASRDSLSGDEKQSSINDSISSGGSCMIQGIPDALSFDRIVAGGVCPVRLTNLLRCGLHHTNNHISHALSAIS